MNRMNGLSIRTMAALGGFIVIFLGSPRFVRADPPLQVPALSAGTRPLGDGRVGFRWALNGTASESNGQLPQNSLAVTVQSELLLDRAGSELVGPPNVRLIPFQITLRANLNGDSPLSQNPYVYNTAVSIIQYIDRGLGLTADALQWTYQVHAGGADRKSVV